ncbi:MAG: CDP-glycerol glycerophosphotransferase family protein [Lachnospiraceae bacterium]|nr:CDP-glycerol glycerophosphotransferase family protein [Lachnospiraceae bacterium]
MIASHLLPLLGAVIAKVPGQVLPVRAFALLPRAAAYIDPATGGMLFTLLLGVIGGVVYGVRVSVMKLRLKLLGRGKTDPNKAPFAVFSDNKRYWNVFAPVVRELCARGRKVLYLTASEDDPAFSCGIEGVTAEYIGSGNAMFGRLNNLNAAVVLSTTPGLEVYQWKRAPKASWYVHIAHAPSDITLYRMFGIDYYDEILLSGDYQVEQVRALEALRSLPAKQIEIVGLPYLDEMAARAFPEGTNPCADPAHETTVLLAPSWGKSAILARYGGRIIEVLLATGYHVIVRPHPQSFTAEKELLDQLMRDYPESDRLEWNRDLDNRAVLARSDIMVSDFSGVIFEFALIYERPVIYTDPDFDLAPYDAWWLDKEVWTLSALPRLGQQLTEDNMENLKSLVDRCLTDPRFAAGRAQVKAETWAHQGEGAVRAADCLMARYESLTAGEEAAR